MKRRFAWALPVIFMLSAAISAATAHADLGPLMNDAEGALVTDTVGLVRAVLFNKSDTVSVTDTERVMVAAQAKHGEPISINDSAHLSPAVRLTVVEAIHVSDTVPDSTPPTVTLTAKPTNPTNSTQATFTWTIADPDNSTGFSSFCKLDTGNFAACVSGVVYAQLGDGQHSFTVHAADPAGNRSTDVSFSWLVDSTAPTIRCDAPDALWHAGDVSLKCTASDSGSGLANPSDANFTLSTSVPAETETANATTGARQVCDVLNNCATAGPISGIKVDKKAPTIIASAVTAADNKPYAPGTWTNQSVLVTFACTDGGSGVDVVTITAPVTLTADGKDQAATGDCSDLVGNTATATFANVDIDKTAPTITYQGQSPAANSAGWNNTNVVLGWTCADALSGSVAASVTATIATEGTNQSASGTCSDKAGNTATNTQGGINIDMTPPLLVATGQTADGKAYASGNWTNQNVIVTFTCTDDRSGVASVSGPVTVATEGTNQLATGNCADNAGNAAAPLVFGGIDIDKTPPVVAASANTADGKAYVSGSWTNQNVIVTFTCTDDRSGVAGVTAPITVATEGTNQSVTGICADKAGNSASPVTIGGIDIDKTPPVLAASAKTADGAIYVSGTWTGQNVTVTFTCTDDRSGVASVTAPVTVTTEGANQSVTGHCTDNAGNAANPVTFSGIDIDRTPPTTTFTSSPGPLDGRALVTVSTQVSINQDAVSFSATCYDSFGVNVVLSATDNVSGVAYIRYGIAQVTPGHPLPNPSLDSTINGSSGTLSFVTGGVYVLNFAAVDVAGNLQATQTRWIFVNDTDGTTCASAPVPVSSLPLSGTVMVRGQIDSGDLHLPINFTFHYQT